MRLPSFRWLLKTDYEEQYDKLIETMSKSLNYGIDALYQALNKQLTLRDNIKCTVKDITLKVDASGIPITRTSFILDLTGKLDGTQVILAINQTNSQVYPSGGIFISFSQNDKIVTITNITGLTPNDVYLIRLIAWNN